MSRPDLNTKPLPTPLAVKAVEAVMDPYPSAESIEDYEKSEAEAREWRAERGRRVVVYLAEGRAVWQRIQDVAVGPGAAVEAPDGWDAHDLVLSFGEWPKLRAWLEHVGFDGGPGELGLDNNASILLLHVRVTVTLGGIMPPWVRGGGQ